jgi:hypothetical protein
VSSRHRPPSSETEGRAAGGDHLCTHNRLEAAETLGHQVASRLSRFRTTSIMRTISLGMKSAITRSKRDLCYLYEFDMNHLPYSILTATNSNHYLLDSLLPVGQRGRCSGGAGSWLQGRRR